MKTTEAPENIDRRQLLAAAAAMTATMASANVMASSEHHHHGSNPYAAVIDAALDCVKKGEACSSHCIGLIRQGDTDMIDCLDTVTTMLPMCGVLSKLASSRSKHLYDLAQVCIAVCKDCEKECRVHKDKHAECKACMESCAACIKECEKLVA